MKNIIKGVLVILGIVVVLLSSKINSKLSMNTLSLEKSLKDNQLETGMVKDLINFEYDYIHIFAPYQSKKSMEKQIGFKLFHLQESTSEDMVNILFVKNKEARAYIYGRTREDGYILELDHKNAPMIISKDEMDKLKFNMKKMIRENPPYKKYILDFDN